MKCKHKERAPERHETRWRFRCVTCGKLLSNLPKAEIGPERLMQVSIGEGTSITRGFTLDQIESHQFYWAETDEDFLFIEDFT